MDQVMAGYVPVRCPRCGGRHIGGQDFRSGMYEQGGTFVRLHLPRYTMRCLDPRCRYSAVVYFGAGDEVEPREEGPALNV